MTALLLDAPLVTYAPMQQEDVVSMVCNFMRASDGSIPRDFQSTHNALRTLWPSIAKEKEAFCLLAVDVYLQIAELEHFSVEPETFISQRVA